MEQVKKYEVDPLVIQEIPIKKITPSNANYEIYDLDDPAGLEALMDDIGMNGQIDPIVLSMDVK